MGCVRSWTNLTLKCCVLAVCGDATSMGTAIQWKLTAEQQSTVERYLGFSRWMAKRMQGMRRFERLTFDELQSACVLGLVYAARGYDPERKVGFMAYAGRAMYQFANRELRSRYAASVPYHVTDCRQRGVRDYAESQEYAGRAWQTVGLMDHHAVTGKDGVRVQVQRRELRGRLEGLLESALSESQRRVIRQRYFEEKLFGEIAEGERVTRQRAQQVADAALKRLKDAVIRAGGWEAWRCDD